MKSFNLIIVRFIVCFHQLVRHSDRRHETDRNLELQVTVPLAMLSSYYFLEIDLL